MPTCQPSHSFPIAPPSTTSSHRHLPHTAFEPPSGDVGCRHEQPVYSAAAHGKQRNSSEALGTNHIQPRSSAKYTQSTHEVHAKHTQSMRPPTQSTRGVHVKQTRSTCKVHARHAMYTRRTREEPAKSTRPTLSTCEVHAKYTQSTRAPHEVHAKYTRSTSAPREERAKHTRSTHEVHAPHANHT